MRMRSIALFTVLMALLEPFGLGQVNQTPPAPGGLPAVAASPPAGLSVGTLSNDQIRELIRRVAENDIENDKKQRDYTYTEHEAEQRLDAMVRTSNGFEIAELDLQLRGPGEFFGTKQAGMPDFRVANLLRDRELLELAKREAAYVIGGPHPDLSEAEIKATIAHLRTHWNRRYGLVEVG